MGELNIPKKKRDELENTVVQLSLDNSFKFPKTSRVTDKFLVERNHYLFAVDYYGQLEVYDLKTGEKISRFIFNQNISPNSIERMVGDKSHIYLQIKGGEFNPTKNDILLAKIKNSDGIGDCCEFIGKKIEDLPKEDFISTYHPAKKSGIIGRIDSFSIDEFLKIKPSLIWGTDFFGARNARFLIHKDMTSLDALNSEEDYVYGVYNYSLEDPFLGGSFRLKSGKLFFEEISPRGKSLEGDLLELPLHIITNVSSQIGISASLKIQNLNRTDDYEEDEGEYFPFEIIFKNGKLRNNETKIVEIQHKEGFLHILRREDKYKQLEGSWNVSSPARLDSYKVELKRLT